MPLHKPVIYGPAIEAAQAFAAVGCRSFSRHGNVFTGTTWGYPSGSSFATPLASPFGSIEPNSLLEGV